MTFIYFKCLSQVGFQIVPPCNGFDNFKIVSVLPSKQKKTDGLFSMKVKGFTKSYPPKLIGYLVGSNPPNLCPANKNRLYRTNRLTVF